MRSSIRGKLAVALGGLSEAPEGYVPRLFGHGRLAFTVDQGQHTQRYQGVVPLEGRHAHRLRPHLFPPVRAAADRHQDRGQARGGGTAPATGGRPALTVQADCRSSTPAASISMPSSAGGRLAQGGDPDGLGDRCRDARSQAGEPAPAPVAAVPRRKARVFRAGGYSAPAAAAAASASTACCGSLKREDSRPARQLGSRGRGSANSARTEYAYDEGDSRSDLRLRGGKTSWHGLCRAHPCHSEV